MSKLAETAIPSTAAELIKEIEESKHQLQRLRFQRATGQLRQVHLFGYWRKRVARAMTKLTALAVPAVAVATAEHVNPESREDDGYTRSPDDE